MDRADAREPGLAELAVEHLRGREPSEVDLEDRREEPVQPVAADVRGVEAGDDQTAVGPQHPPELGERARPVEHVDDESRDRALERGGLEGELLGRGLAERNARRLRAGDRQHLVRRVDGPDLRSGAIGQRGGEEPRAAPDLEDPPATQIALADEDVEEVPPVLVGGPELVVRGGALAEVRRPR